MAPLACGDDGHRLRVRAPVPGRLLPALLRRDDGVSLQERVQKRAHVFPSPSARELAQSGRR